MLNNKESELIYKKYYPIIRKYYTSKQINYNKSKELTHDCLTNILLNNNDIDKFTIPYIIKSAKNYLINFNTKKINKIKNIDISTLDFQQTIDQENDYTQLKKYLKKNFNSEDFLIIDYYFFQNYKPSELAILFNLDVKKIKNKINYLRNKIKKLISL